MITLNRVKKHLRFDDDDNTEDNLIIDLIVAANAWTKRYLCDNYPEENSLDMGLVEAAELMLIGEMFENREISVESELRRSKTFFMLLEPLRDKTVR